MKFLLKLLFVVLSLIAILLIVALFVDGDYTVTRSIEVQKSQADIYDYVSHLKNQQEYGVWHKMDSKIIIKSSGVDGTVGFTSSWNSKMDDVGQGEQEIIKLIDGKQIETEIRFKRPMEVTSRATIDVKKKSEVSSTVSWTFTGEQTYPFNLISLFLDMDKEIGPDLENGLKNLKVILESENK